MPQFPEKHVVTCFIECGGMLLLLKRSNRVGSFKGRWAGVSGYVEGSADEQSLIEIAEETGLNAGEVTLVKKGETLVVEDADTGTCWVIHPYLYRTISRERIKTDWEHSRHCWIKPEEMGGFETVPMLEEALMRVYPP